MSIKDKIIKAFGRGMGEDSVNHMFDCEIYNSFLGVCTCGLNHWLRQASAQAAGQADPTSPEYNVSKLFDKFLMEGESNAGFIDCLLKDFASGNLYVKRDGKFVKVEKPIPPSEEEVDRRMDELFDTFEKLDSNDKKGDDED